MREGKISVGFTGCERSGHIPGGPIWMLHWLPTGSGPTKNDRLVCAFFDPRGEINHDLYGLSRDRLPPLIAAVSNAIEKHIRDHPEDLIGHIESDHW